MYNNCTGVSKLFNNTNIKYSRVFVLFTQKGEYSYSLGTLIRWVLAVKCKERTNSRRTPFGWDSTFIAQNIDSDFCWHTRRSCSSPTPFVWQCTRMFAVSLLIEVEGGIGEVTFSMSFTHFASTVYSTLLALSHVSFFVPIGLLVLVVTSDLSLSFECIRLIRMKINIFKYLSI